MFQDLFDTAEQISTGVKEGQVQSAWDRLPRSCADSLPLPELARQPGYPIGLKNQGATCYLNSLLQILFLTPELRKIILQLPLCKENTETKTDYIQSVSKHRFMLGFQRLFSQMSLKDTYSVSTDYLNQAFGWKGSEHMVQHDIQQAKNIIFDSFERSLHGTPYEKNIKQLFKGVSTRYKTCRNCTVVDERLEQIFGLNLQVKNIKSLQQSMLNILQAQSMQGSNQIYCQTCQSKQDMWLGTKLKTLPNILVFTLRRFDFDYNTFQRVRLNDYFSFELEYNFEHMLDQTPIGEEAGAPGSFTEYQLYGVLIHSGSAHSGHYYCYIRDLMQESDWEKGLKQTEKRQKQQKQKQDQKKQKQAQSKQNIMKQQPTTTKPPQQPAHKLKQPKNPQLLQNWYQLDDSRVTAIDANKIASKYEGAASAYILFYRKKNLKLPTEIHIPDYFANPIKLQNQLLNKERSEYNQKKNQIILKIDQHDEILAIDTRVNDVIAMFCPYGYSLVNQAKMNGLAYYPKQLNSLKQYSQQQTIKSYDIIHESTWKKYQIQSTQYQQIKQKINQQWRPFQINLYFNQKNQKLTVYQNQTLNSLRLHIEKSPSYQIPFQSQIIKLVTAYREYFVTDQLANNDVLLTKLGFVHECQVVLKRLDKEKEDGEGEGKEEEKVESNTVCFVVERDDVHGVKRMYFDKHKTLKELFQFIVQSEGLDNTVTRRFRNLNGDRLFYDQHYLKKLTDLNFNQQIIKLRIQRGQIPIKGDICILAKIQSKFHPETSPQQLESIFDPNTTIETVKRQFCQLANLNPDQHRLYQTDWMGEPARCVTREKLSIFDCKFGREEKICIRDVESPIGAELVCLEVYETKVGTPEDVGQPYTTIKIEEFKTIKDLKQQILKTKICKQYPQGQLTTNHLRIRQIKKDYMFGTILRQPSKQLKSFTFNANKIVVQILNHEQHLTENQIVLVLKKRNIQKKIYEGHAELVFEAGKQPTVEILVQAVKGKVGAEMAEGEAIRVCKYVHYDFQWVEVSERYIEKFVKSRTKNENDGKNKKKDGKKDGKKEGKKDGKKEQIKGKKEQQKVQNTTQIKTQETKQDKKSEQVTQTSQNKKDNNQIQDPDKKQPKQSQKQPQNQQKKKAPKQKKDHQPKQPQSQPHPQMQRPIPQTQKQPPTQKQQPKKQQCLNLRKPPYMLKDGDWIGYSIGEGKVIEADDLQTDDDKSLKVLKQNQKAVAKHGRRGKSPQPFTVDI